MNPTRGGYGASGGAYQPWLGGEFGVLPFGSQASSGMALGAGDFNSVRYAAHVSAFTRRVNW